MDNRNSSLDTLLEQYEAQNEDSGGKAYVAYRRRRQIDNDELCCDCASIICCDLLTDVICDS